MANGGTHLSVDVSQIELDRTNPRIVKFLEMHGENPTPEQIFLALGASSDEDGNSTSFEKLKQSILTNGGIIQPVLLNRQADGQLVCIEGNTRVALYKHFQQNNVKGNWTHIPAIVYDNIEPIRIHAIRLQLHLVGVRQWDPYSKAKYLYELRTQEHMPFASMVDYCGGREKELVENINAYEDMETYYRSILDDDGDFDTTRFSGFVELQKSGVKQAISQAGFTITDFATWIHESKIYPLQKVRVLPRILRNEKAREIFLKFDAKKAEAILERPDLNKTLQEADLGQLARALSAQIAALPWSEQKRLKADPGCDTTQALTELQAELSGLIASLNAAE